MKALPDSRACDGALERQLGMLFVAELLGIDFGLNIDDDVAVDLPMTDAKALRRKPGANTDDVRRVADRQVGSISHRALVGVAPCIDEDRITWRKEFQELFRGTHLLGFGHSSSIS